jgi:peptidase M28-like protein
MTTIPRCTRDGIGARDDNVVPEKATRNDRSGNGTYTGRAVAVAQGTMRGHDDSLAECYHLPMRTWGQGHEAWMRSLLWCATIAVVATSSLAPVLAAQSLTSGVVLEAEARVREDLVLLASPRLEGRSAGTPGADTAANFIARRFWELGLQAAFRTDECNAKGACRPSYLQAFRAPDYTTTNIGAIVPGTDSSLRNDYVAISAHYDHIGRMNGGQGDYAPANTIHPGADDNASGTAAALELARRFSANPLKRSVIVLAFGAEEFGLVGSRVFVENPPLDLQKIAVVLNLDMVGRLHKNRLQVFGAEGKLKSIVERANTEPPFSLATKPKSSGRSDDFSFSSHRVAALHFTTGEHEDYHRATDTADRIDLVGLVRVIDYVERVARLVDR